MEAMETIYVVDDFTATQGTSRRHQPDSDPLSLDSSSSEIIEIEDVYPTNSKHVFGKTYPVLATDQKRYPSVDFAGTSTRLQPDSDPLSLNSSSSKIKEIEGVYPTNSKHVFGKTYPVLATEHKRYPSVDFAGTSTRLQPDSDPLCLNSSSSKIKEIEDVYPTNGKHVFGKTYPVLATDQKRYPSVDFAGTSTRLQPYSDPLSLNSSSSKIKGPVQVVGSLASPAVSTCMSWRGVPSRHDNTLMRPLTADTQRCMENLSRLGGPLREKINSSAYRSDGTGQLKIIHPNLSARLETSPSKFTGGTAAESWQRIQGNVRNMKEQSILNGLLWPEVFKLNYQGNATPMSSQRSFVTEKPFECNICKKKFSQQAYLHSHEKRHMMKKCIECPVCIGTSFSSEKQLICHMAIHDGRKLYECDVCKKSFSDSYKMKRHRRNLHPGAKPIEFYESAKCMNAMKKKKNKIRHSSETSSSLSEFELKAAKCTKTMKKKKNKIRHSSETSSSLSEFELIEQDEEYERLFQSDNELSHESDVEILEDAEEIRYARTASTLGRVPNGEEADSRKTCQRCGKPDQPGLIILCHQCDSGWHTSCLKPSLLLIPTGDWYCPSCSHVRLINSLRLCLLDFDQMLLEKAEMHNGKKRTAENVKPGEARFFKTLRLSLIDCVQPRIQKDKCHKIESLETYRAGDLAAQEMLKRQFQWRSRSPSGSNDYSETMTSENNDIDSDYSDSSDNYVPIRRPNRDLLRRTRSTNLAKAPLSQKERKPRRNRLEFADSSDLNDVMETKTRLQSKRCRKQRSRLCLKPTTRPGKVRFFKTLRLSLIDCLQPTIQKENRHKIESLEKYSTGDYAAQEMLDRQFHWRISSGNRDPGRSDSDSRDSSSSSSSENSPIWRPNMDLLKSVTRTKSGTKEPVSPKEQNRLEFVDSCFLNGVMEIKNCGNYSQSDAENNTLSFV